MKYPRTFWLTVIPISLGGLLLRFWFAGEPLWLDELHTAWCVDGSFVHIGHRAGQGSQTPLFYWLTAAVTSLTGTNVFSLRAVSLMFGTLSIIGCAATVYRLTQNLPAAVATAVLVSIDAWLLFYSTESRPYAMLQLLSLLQFLVLAACVNGSATELRTSWLLVVLTGLVLATHLTGALLIMSEILVLLATGPKKNMSRIGSLAAGTLLALPAVMFSLPAFEIREQWISMSGPEKLFQDWKIPLLLQTLPAVLLTASSWFLDANQRQLQRWCLAAILWATLPLVLALVLDAVSIPVASYRFTTVSSLAPAVCIALSVPLNSSRKITTIGLILVTGFSVLLSPVTVNCFRNANPPRFRNENWESAVEFVNSLETEQPLFLFANIYEDRQALVESSPAFQDYLSFPVRGPYKITAEKTVISMPTLSLDGWLDEHVQRIRTHQGACLICRVGDDQFQKIQASLHSNLKRNGLRGDIESFQQLDNVLKIAVVRIRNEYQH